MKNSNMAAASVSQITALRRSIRDGHTMEALFASRTPAETDATARRAGDLRRYRPSPRHNGQRKGEGVSLRLGRARGQADFQQNSGARWRGPRTPRQLCRPEHQIPAPVKRSTRTKNKCSLSVHVAGTLTLHTALYR